MSLLIRQPGSYNSRGWPYFSRYIRDTVIIIDTRYSSSMTEIVAITFRLHAGSIRAYLYHQDATVPIINPGISEEYDT